MSDSTFMNNERTAELIERIKSRMNRDLENAPDDVKKLAAVMLDVSSKTAAVAIEEYEHMLREESSKPL